MMSGCPLYPRKRTSERSREMSALGQKRTSSARIRKASGSSSPRVFAVFWLITNSSFAGCSTGKSLGLA